MIEETKPVWHYERPEFEDVEGKTILVEHFNGVEIYCSVKVIYDMHDLEMSTGNFKRYAIVNTEEEPLPYKGMLPVIEYIEHTKKWVCRVDCCYLLIETHHIFGDTREQAIRYWNEFVRKNE